MLHIVKLLRSEVCSASFGAHLTSCFAVGKTLHYAIRDNFTWALPKLHYIFLTLENRTRENFCVKKSIRLYSPLKTVNLKSTHQCALYFFIYWRIELGRVFALRNRFFIFFGSYFLHIFIASSFQIKVLPKSIK